MCRPLTVPDRMSWGQQLRRWLLQTRSSVNLTLCLVSSPETVQKEQQMRKTSHTWYQGRGIQCLKHILLWLLYINGSDTCDNNCIQRFCAQINCYISQCLYYLPVTEQLCLCQCVSVTKIKVTCDSVHTLYGTFCYSGCLPYPNLSETVTISEPQPSLACDKAQCVHSLNVEYY